VKRKHRLMQISEGELTAMTRDLEAAHRESLPRLQEAIDELRSGRSASRRGFLFGAVGVTAGGLVLAACGGDNKSSGSSSTVATTGATTATTAMAATTMAPATTTAAGGASGLTGDLAIAALAAALENTAVATYQAGLDAAAAGKLGAVPPAVATFAKTAQAQHKDHAAAWNAVLTSAGKPAMMGIDKTVQDGLVTPGFANVKDVVGLAKFALVLEDAAAATYLNGIENALQDAGAIKVAASIQPVEMQHSAILHFILGYYPGPDCFAKTAGARGPDDVIG
jgi:hypothetical protein